MLRVTETTDIQRAFVPGNKVLKTIQF
uniref:Uncharacterized protein n=1 Tax=Rhizophora mucronata TaxID=61149 RepID=A0A2P2Q1B7_RHIMU